VVSVADVNLHEASDGIRMQKEADMDKDAATAEQRQKELEAFERWKLDKNPQDFKFLLDSFRPLMYAQGRRYLQTAQLPRSAVEADMIQHFHRALETYDPNKGAQMNTHIWNHLQHTGRFLRTYTNIGKIPEPRARQIGTYQARESIMQESLGRIPTTTEMADAMSISPREIELLRKEIRSDILTEEAHEGLAGVSQETPKALEQVQFLHMELNPEQQLVLEHTYGMYGRQSIDNNDDLARILNMTPQKVRAIKRQIARRYEKRYQGF
jgi:DNA-directed RNA polymerase specialized sigma subunit